MSKAVKERVQRCLTVVFAGRAYADVLVEAALRVMHVHLLRERELVAADGDQGEDGGPSVKDMMRLAAEDLERRCGAMVEADAVLVRVRAELRRCRARRDRRAARKVGDSESIRLKATVGGKQSGPVRRRRIVHRVEPPPARLRLCSRRGQRPASSSLVASASAWWRRFRGGVMG